MLSAATSVKQGAPEHGTSAGAGLMITCEHGGNRIPLAYRALFAPHRDALASHRGFDAGALLMARALAAAFGAPLLAATVSRLLVDLNRSIGHPHLHFEPVRALPGAQRKSILTRHYQPYRGQAERLVNEAIAAHGRVIHLSCHSFTPELRGERRTADIGLLYDPARPGEKALCARWKRTLETRAPALAVRRNYPYAGRNDGLTAWLRKHHPPEHYIGVELELNQELVRRNAHRWAALREVVIASFRAALAGGNELAGNSKPLQASIRSVETPCAASGRVRRRKGGST